MKTGRHGRLDKGHHRLMVKDDNNGSQQQLYWLLFIFTQVSIDWMQTKNKMANLVIAYFDSSLAPRVAY